MPSKKTLKTKKRKSMKGGWKYRRNTKSRRSRKMGGQCGCNKFTGGFGDNVGDAKGVIPLNSYNAGDPSRDVMTEHKGMMGGKRKRMGKGKGKMSGGILSGYGPNDVVSNFGIVPNMQSNVNSMYSTMGLVNPAAYSQQNVKTSSMV